MGPFTGLVLFLTIWAIVFLAAIPIRLQTQGEAGDVVRGTHSASPQRHNLKKKAAIATVISVLLWVLVAWAMLTGAVTLDDVDLYSRFGPGPVEGRGLGG